MTRAIWIIIVLSLGGFGFYQQCITQGKQHLPMSLLKLVHIGHVAVDLWAIIGDRKVVHAGWGNASLTISMNSMLQLQVHLAINPRRFWEQWAYPSCNEQKECLWIPIFNFGCFWVAKKDCSNVKNEPRLHKASLFLQYKLVKKTTGYEYRYTQCNQDGPLQPCTPPGLEVPRRVAHLVALHSNTTG